MRRRRSAKLVHEGRYVAEVDIELIDADEVWAPYSSLDDALRLDNVRDARRRGGLESAGRHARLYSLTSIAV
jgi:hypothetical protein